MVDFGRVVQNASKVAENASRVVDNAGRAVNHAGHTVGGLVRRAGDRPVDARKPQTVTVTAPRAQVMQFWRDPENLSRVFGDHVRVETVEANRMRWTWDVAGRSTIWDTRVDVTSEGLAFVGEDDADTPGPRVVLAVSDAPRGSTAMTLRAQVPAPDLVTGAWTFTALYRARALMQTGEIPTLQGSPSARESEGDA
ncbi:SRPBCC family protein [Rhodococcus gordoniae]